MFPGPAVNFTACNFEANLSPWAAGALQVRDNARVIVLATVFTNNTSLKPDPTREPGSGGAVSIHNNATGGSYTGVPWYLVASWHACWALLAFGIYATL